LEITKKKLILSCLGFIKFIKRKDMRMVKGERGEEERIPRM